MCKLSACKNVPASLSPGQLPPSSNPAFPHHLTARPSCLLQGHYERPPYNAGSMRSAYHIRALEVHRLLRLSRPLDVFLSHDWPQGIARHGNLGSLLQRKAFLRREVCGPGWLWWGILSWGGARAASRSMRALFRVSLWFYCPLENVGKGMPGFIQLCMLACCPQRATFEPLTGRTPREYTHATIAQPFLHMCRRSRTTRWAARLPASS